MPFLFAGTIKAITYAIAWLLYAALHLASMCMLVEAPFEALLTDALLHAALFAGLGLLIIAVLQNAGYEAFSPVRRCSNYIMLALLTAGLWTGAGYLGDRLILDETAYAFVYTLPVKGLIGMMIYTVFVLSYHLNKKLTCLDKSDNKPENKPNLPPTDKPAAPSGEIYERITVKDRQNIHLIPLNEIVYLQSYGDYVYLFTQTDRYLKETTMKYLEEHLPKNFVRIHRSYIINIEYISRIESFGRQSQQVTLKTGQWLNISPAGYKTLKSALNL